MTAFLRTLPCWILLFLIGGCAPGEAPSPANPAESAEPVASTLPSPAQEVPEETSSRGLQGRVRAAILHVRQRDLLVSNSFWTVFHGLLGVGPDVTLLDPDTRKRVGALDYICQGGEIRGLQFIPTANGLDVRLGPFFVGQGHQDQFIAEMAQWGMPLDRSFQVNGRSYTFEDFVRHAQARASTQNRQELSWAILIIGQYRGTTISWVNERGEKLDFDDVVRYELNEPVDSAACGGTHRLFGLSWVYHLHMQRGGTKTAVWQDLVTKTGEYVQRARRYQNSDGSFSSRYLAGPGMTRDPQLRIGTTGHVLEWLSLALPDAELGKAWVEEAANALALMILESKAQPIESGALYHATHGLQMYHVRRYGPLPGVPVPLIPPHPDDAARKKGA
jgi:hypothetical protein